MPISRAIREAFAALACFACLAAAVPAQQRIVIRTAAVPGPTTVKLSPELHAAQRIGGALVGFTIEGEAVLRLPPGTSIEAHTRTLAATPGVRSWHRLTGERVLPTKTVLAFFRPGQEPAAESLNGFTMLRSHRPRLRPPGHDNGEAPYLRPFLVLQVDGDLDAAHLDALQQNDAVVSVEPDFTYRLSGSRRLSPDDPRYHEQWGLQRIGAEAAWDSVTSSPAIVAVLDTGIDLTHTELQANLWANAGEDGGTAGVDDDNDGLIDDVHGYDFVHENGDVSDHHGHGTQCAGIIGARGNNTAGIAGVVWDVKLMTCKVFDASGEGGAADVIVRALDYARLKGATVIDNSWGGPAYSTAIADAIERARLDGVLVVCAAGNGDRDGGTDNDARPFYPASYWHDNIIAVMASSDTDAPTAFSNYGGLSVDLAAPGESIVTTDLNGGYASVDGTSFAAPFVAGAAALVLAGGSTTATAAKTALLDHVYPVAPLDGLCLSKGVLDISFLGPTALARSMGARTRDASGQRRSQEPREGASQESEVRRWTGTLVYPAYAIGGETTGAVLRLGEGQVELDVSGLDKAKALLEQLAGRPVVVEGTLKVVPGVEIETRRIVTVTSLKPREGQ